MGMLNWKTWLEKTTCLFVVKMVWPVADVQDHQRVFVMIKWRLPQVWKPFEKKMIVVRERYNFFFLTQTSSECFDPRIYLRVKKKIDPQIQTTPCAPECWFDRMDERTRMKRSTFRHLIENDFVRVWKKRFIKWKILTRNPVRITWRDISFCPINVFLFTYRTKIVCIMFYIFNSNSAKNRSRIVFFLYLKKKK